MARVAPLLETTRTALTWSEDEATVTKRPTSAYHDTILGSYRDAFLNEIRVNRMLAEQPPPVPTPRLVHLPRDRCLTFHAVDGDPLAPKFRVAWAPARSTSWSCWYRSWSRTARGDDGFGGFDMIDVCVGMSTKD